MTDGLTDGAWLGCISADQRWFYSIKSTAAVKSCYLSDNEQKSDVELFHRRN